MVVLARIALTGGFLVLIAAGNLARSAPLENPVSIWANIATPPPGAKLDVGGITHTGYSTSAASVIGQGFRIHDSYIVFPYQDYVSYNVRF